MKFGVLTVSAILVIATTAMGQVKVDPALPEYKPVAAMSGTIKSVGSDTMSNMMTLWSEGFKSTGI